MKKNFWYKTAVSAASLAMIFGLAGCGQKNNSSSNSNSPKSAKTTISEADKAYAKANDLISEGKYTKAYNLLDNVENDNQKVDYLEDDLENYIDAAKEYKQGKYTKAETTLTAMKSSSKPMKAAYKALRTKITKALDSEQTSSSSARVNKQGNSRATVTSSSSQQTAANAEAAKNTSEDVVTSFANKMGFNKKGYGIIPVSVNGNTYTFEVRQDNADNSVANMVGIYRYDKTSGAVTKIG